MHMHIGWPQGLFLGLIAFALLFGSVGEKKSAGNAIGTALAVAAQLGLLYWGGFFG